MRQGESVLARLWTQPPRMLAYCHDSVGIGHLRRTLAITERVGKNIPDCSFLLATGTPYVPLFTPERQVDYIKLPALTKTGGVYSSKFLSLSLDELMRCRQSLLLETVRSFKPNVMLVDKAPLGVCRELVPALRWLRENRPNVPVVFGMRDIEDDSQATVAQWARDGVCEVLETCYSEIWVYGMESVFDVARQYDLSDAIRSKLRYMGYIARPPCTHDAPNGREPSLLVTVGGGSDGERVLSCYLEQAADRVGSRRIRSLIVGGPDLPPAANRRLRKLAAGQPHTTWLDYEPCMSCRIRDASWVVTMGGYNTLCELAIQGKPALVIPRTTPRLEQKIRAELWERLGVVHMLGESEFTADGLARRVEEMIGNGKPRSNEALDLNGLDRVAKRFEAFMTTETPRAAAVRM